MKNDKLGILPVEDHSMASQLVKYLGPLLLIYLQKNIGKVIIQNW